MASCSESDRRMGALGSWYDCCCGLFLPSIGLSSFPNLSNWNKGTSEPLMAWGGDGYFFESCQMCYVVVSKCYFCDRLLEMP